MAQMEQTQQHYISTDLTKVRRCNIRGYNKNRLSQGLRIDKTHIYVEVKFIYRMKVGIGSRNADFQTSRN
jgi:hypothetical protein